MDSVLTSIKKLLGVDEDYEHFDVDIMMHINSVLMRLNQLGVGPTKGYHISSKAETWSDFIGDRDDLEAVKTYVYDRVRLIFDPPSAGYLVEAIKERSKEFEWCINVQVEGGPDYD